MKKSYSEMFDMFIRYQNGAAGISIVAEWLKDHLISKRSLQEHGFVQVYLSRSSAQNEKKRQGDVITHFNMGLQE